MFNKVRAATLLSAACLAAFLAPPVVAQEGIVEEVYVTGSRIARSGFDYAAPVDIYTAEDIAKSSATSIDEFLMKTPTFSGFQYGTSTNNGNNGVKMVDMRGLGTKRTLVLINGRRTVGSFIGGPLETGAVDLNAIPLSMVERVEVLKDGASSVYGSDALGGVVNIILKSRFEGFEITGDSSWGEEDWDTKHESLSLVMGAASDRGGVTLGIEYSKQGEMKQGERSWAQNALYPLQNPDGSFTSQSVGSSNRQTLRLDDLAVRDAIELAGGPADQGSWRVDTNGVPQPYNPLTDSYNFAPVNALITPNERFQISALGEYDLFDFADGVVRAHAELSYTNRTSHQRLAPDASFNLGPFSNPTRIDGIQDNDWVPANNPHNPFGDTPNNPWGISGEGVRVNRRFEESGGRLFSQDVDTYRFVAGLDGTFMGVNWDFSYIWAENDESYETNFYHNFDNWQTIVDPILCADDPACVAATDASNALNPFSDLGELSDAEIGYLMTNSLKDIYRNQMSSYTLSFNGDLPWEMPAGTIGWAAGYEHRDESAEISPDEFSAQGLTTGGALDPLKGSFYVDELYAEFAVPILADMAYAQALDLELSIRYSNYNTPADDDTNYRIGAKWQVNDSVGFRGGYATGFRAPNIIELVGGQATTFPVVEFPCEFYGDRAGLSPNVATNCAAAGIPGDDFELGFAWQSFYVQTAPESLDPEESKTFTLGVVLTPQWWDWSQGLQISLDWFDIEIDDLIGLPDFNGLLLNCLSAADQSAAESCSFFLGDDGIAGNSDGTGVFAGLFPDDAEVSLANLGKLETSGLDFDIAYGTEVDWGFISTLDLGITGTYVDEFKQTFPNSGSQDLVGTAGADSGARVYPEWRWNTNATVGGESWSVGWTMRYYDEVTDLWRPENLTDAYKGDDILYHDLIGTYVYGNFTAYLGVDNIGDEEPSRTHTAFNANTYPGTYDVIGRKWWFRVQMVL